MKPWRSYFPFTLVQEQEMKTKPCTFLLQHLYPIPPCLLDVPLPLYGLVLFEVVFGGLMFQCNFCAEDERMDLMTQPPPLYCSVNMSTSTPRNDSCQIGPHIDFFIGKYNENS